jgi:hypothetical protein
LSVDGLAVESAAAARFSQRVQAALLAEHRGAMAWCLGVERKLLGLGDAFDAKASGSLSPRAPRSRTRCTRSLPAAFADLDLLVSTADYERACTVGSLGHGDSTRAPAQVGRVGKASVHTHPEDASRSTHRTLVIGPFGLWIRPEELLERREPFLLAGQKLSRLDDTGAVNVAMHARSWWPSRLVPSATCAGEDAGLVDGVCSNAGKARHPTAVLDRAYSLSASTPGVDPDRAHSISRSVPAGSGGH